MDHGLLTDPVNERPDDSCTLGSTTVPGPPSAGKTWRAPFPLEADAAAIRPPSGSTAKGNVNGFRSSGLYCSESTTLGTTTAGAHPVEIEKLRIVGVRTPPSPTVHDETTP